MILIIGLALLSISALLVNSLFRHASRASFLVGMSLIAYAGLVLIAEVASLLHQINTLFFLLAELVLAGFAWFLWRWARKPALLGLFSGGRWAIWREFLPFRSAPALYLLAAGVGLTYFLGAFLILAFPQHNFDSMSYHLARAGYWLQHHSLAPWPTPNPRQTSFPINAELGSLWTMLSWGSDQMTGFVQWFSALLTCVSVYGLARLLGASRPQSSLAALLWATFPEVILQSITTQNDLVVAAFVSSAVYLLYLGLRQHQRGPLMLSGLALGLSLGTKSTTILFLPGLALAVLLAAWRRHKPGVSLAAFWVISAAIAFSLFGAFNYVQNYLYYGNPVSVPEWASDLTNPQVSRKALLTSNVFLYLYQFVDTTGLPERLAVVAIEAKAGLARTAINTFHLPLIPTLPGKFYSLRKALYPLQTVHPDLTWFGLLSSVLLIPACIYQSWQSLRGRDDLRLGLLMIGAGFVFSLSLLMSWSPYKNRYFVPAVAIVAPFLAFLYQPSRWGKAFQWVVLTLALWVMGWTVTKNAYLPLTGENAVWGQASENIRTSGNVKIRPVLDLVDKHVPMNAMLATRLGENDWDYPLFGPKFERRVIQVDPALEGVDVHALELAGVEYLLVSPRERPFLAVPHGLNLIGEANGWTLYGISPQANPEDVPAEEKEKLLGLTDPGHLATVDPALTGIVGLNEIAEFDWGIESYEGRGILWLGEGISQGLIGYLWSEREMPVRVTFDVRPGSGREDTLRHLEFRYYRRGKYGPLREGAIVQQFQISGQTKIGTTVTLQRGLNQIFLFALDEATIRRQPNGDERPLLVLLEHVDILPSQ
jgi:Dolichyl-phosphate-mannose-protein mannosyltransferase